MAAVTLNIEPKAKRLINEIAEARSIKEERNVTMKDVVLDLAEKAHKKECKKQA